MSTQLYAVIKKSSKYAHQQPRDTKGKAVPFKVEIGGGYDAYIVASDDNRYRMADLTFFARVDDLFVKLS